MVATFDEKSLRRDFFLSNFLVIGYVSYLVKLGIVVISDIDYVECQSAQSPTPACVSVKSRVSFSMK